MPRRTDRFMIALTAAALALAVVAGCSDKDEDDDSKSTGYAGALVSSKIFAENKVCQAQLHSIYTALRAWAATHDSYPASLKELSEIASVPAGCPRKPRPDYEYVSGQTTDMPGDNVLIYATGYVHEGKCNVLLLDGRIVGMTADEFAAALAKTKRSIAGG